MSLTGFSIRKLINNQRRTWPESDDENDESFIECSSAKTLRMQSELEQYQKQQLQKGLRGGKGRSSWMSNSSNSPKFKTHKRVPTPIMIVRHASDEVLLKPESASRRISTPLPLSSRTGRFSPGASHSRLSDESMSCPCAEDCRRHHQCQHLAIMPRKSSSALGFYQSPPVSNSLPTAGEFPKQNLNGGSTIGTENSSYELSSFVYETAADSRRRGEQAMVMPSQRQTPSTKYNRQNKTLNAIETPINVAPGASNPHLNNPFLCSRQQTEFVHGVPSPPLDPEDAKGIQSRDQQTLKAMQPMLDPSTKADNTWFNAWEDGDLGIIPDNVQQLILKTDEAFRAVGTALADVREAPQSQPESIDIQAHLQHMQQACNALSPHTAVSDKQLLQTLPVATYRAPVSPARNHIWSMPPASPGVTAGRGSVPSPRKGYKASYPLSQSPDILRSPIRATSVSKAKRGSKSPRQMPRSVSDATSVRQSPAGSSSFNGNGYRPQHSYHRSLSRLNVAADNVTERLLNTSRGRFGFSRIEADEVVTPGQVQQFRQSRLAKAHAEALAHRRKGSSDTLRSASGSVGEGHSSDGTTENTPIEPFHLQDLPERIGSSGVIDLKLLSPVDEVPTPRSFEFNKGAVRNAPELVEPPKTPTDGTKGTHVEPNLLVTPPPTPPQPPAHIAFTVTPAATKVAATDEDDSMQLRSVDLSREPSAKTSRRSTHTRAKSSSSRVPLLPTIPEVKVKVPQAQNLSKNPQQLGRKIPTHAGDENTSTVQVPYFEEDAECMFFTSTSHSAIMPGFQHGRIRLAKADLVNAGTINSLESKLLSSPDEKLDWTAFQMAILGGAGDLYSDPNDFFSRDAQEDLVDELCDWFTGLGLTSGDLGTLITEDPRRANKATVTTPRTPYTPVRKAISSTPGSATRPFHDPLRSRRNKSSSRSRSKVAAEKQKAVAEAQSMPIPVTSEHPSGFWNSNMEASNSEANRLQRGSSCGGIRRSTVEGHPKRYQGPGIDVGKANNAIPPSKTPDHLNSAKRRTVRESIDSLPQSPMLDLVMVTAVDGSKEFVPMGYNLGHDLGDFLKWESEHVYAGAYYGSD